VCLRCLRWSPSGCFGQKADGLRDLPGLWVDVGVGKAALWVGWCRLNPGSKHLLSALKTTSIIRSSFKLCFQFQVVPLHMGRRESALHRQRCPQRRQGHHCRALHSLPCFSLSFAQTKCSEVLSSLSPRNRGFINSMIATRSEFRRFGRRDFEMECSDWSNGLPYHNFDTRPGSDFNFTCLSLAT
jgi:hypothetical protein